MKHLFMTATVEIQKLWKSKAIRVMLAYFLVILCFMIYLMIRKEEIEKYFGLFKLFETILFIGGVLGFGFITAWVFGREYTEGTVKDLLALPSPRYVIILSKFITLSLFCTVVSVLVFITPYVIGMIVFPHDYSLTLIGRYMLSHLALTAIILSLNTPLAFLAICTRGYILPVSCLVFSFIVGVIVNSAGYGQYYPLMLPSVYIEKGRLETVSCLILVLFSLAGFLGTAAWWRYADQNK